MHGNNWKKIAQGLARDPASCKEKWRNLKCTKKGRSLDSELCVHVGSILFLNVLSDVCVFKVSWTVWDGRVLQLTQFERSQGLEMLLWF